MSRTRLCEGIFQTSRVPWMGLAGQLYVVIPEPLKCLTHAPQFAKLREDQLNRFADPSIGMKHDLTQRIQGIADRQSFEQFATARFGLLPSQQSLAYDLEFDHAERPFDAQPPLILEIIQIVDLLLIGDERSKDLAHLQ